MPEIEHCVLRRGVGSTLSLPFLSKNLVREQQHKEQTSERADREELISSLGCNGWHGAMNFGLSSAAESSPRLPIFSDASLLEEQLELCAETYIHQHVSIYLLRAFSFDFSGYIFFFV